jgi:2-phosphoglycerate kinase
LTDRRHRRPLPLGGEDGLPFSKGLMARALILAGISTDRAYEIAMAAEQDIGASGRDSISLERLEEIAQGALGEEDGRNAMRRLRRFQDLYELDLPIILLVGGATGTGKSTIATEAAHRLGITRVTSTDFIRQTMRAFFSPAFMPSVHYSSFEAGLALTKAEEDEAGDARLLGFLDQTRNVLVGVEAAIDRSLAEGWSMVLEGVHLVPGMVDIERGNAIVVQCLVAIEDEDLHRSHFWVRDHATEGLRPLEKYIDGMPEIRMIQGALIERAERCDVPVIMNSTLDQAMGEVLDLVLSTADQLARV